MSLHLLFGCPSETRVCFVSQFFQLLICELPICEGSLPGRKQSSKPVTELEEHQVNVDRQEHPPPCSSQKAASNESGLSVGVKERSRKHDCLGIKPSHQKDHQQGLKVTQLLAEAAVGSNEPIRASRWSLPKDRRI